MNGFQDALLQTYGGAPPRAASLPALRESVIIRPTDTILFGEKASSSAQFDLVLDADASRYLSDLEEARHGGKGGPFIKGGGSNYAMADGGVRLIRYGHSLCPLNLWAVTEQGKADYAVCTPH